MHSISSIPVEPGQAGWRKFRQGKPIKERGELIGTTPDPLAVMAVDCAISWNILEPFLLDISFSWHLCLMMQLSLDPVCPWHLWILTALLVDSSEARDLTHSSLLTMFCWCHRCLLKTDVFSAAFRWRLFLLAALLFGISFSWDLLLLTFSTLYTPFSWYGFLLTPCFLHPFVFATFFFETSFC